MAENTGNHQKGGQVGNRVVDVVVVMAWLEKILRQFV